MQQLETKTVLGLYADLPATSISACLLKTDGLDILSDPVSLTRPYSAELKERLLNLNPQEDLANAELLKELDSLVTVEHLSVAEELLAWADRQVPEPDLVGYSGHTVYQGIADKHAVLLGNGNDLARVLRVPVIDRFIQSDLQAGGTGGPLLSTFWEAQTRKRPKPVGIIALGGITSLTYIGSLGEQYAFDIGVGCLLLDKWLQCHAGLEMDFDGLMGAKGQVDRHLLDYLLKTPYLAQKPPKAIDRNGFNDLMKQVEGSSPADGAATLTAFIVGSITRSVSFLPTPPVEWILTGGGTLNPTLVLLLKKALSGPVYTISDLKWNTYSLEAAAYAFLAARSLMQLPITFPTTTGVPEPLTGGFYHSVSQK